MPGVELDWLVSDNRDVVGTGGGRGRELGGGRGALAVEVDGVGPGKVVAIFINLENRLPFVTFASVSVEGVDKGTVDGASGRGRSSREDRAVLGAGRAGSGAMMGARGLLVSETLPVTDTCGGGSGNLYSETLRWWAAGAGGRVDRGTGGRGRWRGPDGGNGGGTVSS